MNIIEFEDEKQRQRRLDDIFYNYIISLSNNKRLIKIGEKPICLASFFIYDIII